MTDWKRVLADLAEIRSYFAECAKNAADGSAAQQKFVRYIVSIVEAGAEIRHLLDTEEDDGK